MYTQINLTIWKSKKSKQIILRQSIPNVSMIVFESANMQTIFTHSNEIDIPIYADSQDVDILMFGAKSFEVWIK